METGGLRTSAWPLSFLGLLRASAILQRHKIRWQPPGLRLSPVPHVGPEPQSYPGSNQFNRPFNKSLVYEEQYIFFNYQTCGCLHLMPVKPCEPLTSTHSKRLPGCTPTARSAYTTLLPNTSALNPPLLISTKKGWKKGENKRTPTSLTSPSSSAS